MTPPQSLVTAQTSARAAEWQWNRVCSNNKPSLFGVSEGRLSLDRGSVMTSWPEVMTRHDSLNADKEGPSGLQAVWAAAGKTEGCFIPRETDFGAGGSCCLALQSMQNSELLVSGSVGQLPSVRVRKTNRTSHPRWGCLLVSGTPSIKVIQFSDILKTLLISPCISFQTNLDAVMMSKLQLILNEMFTKYFNLKFGS